MNKEPEKRNEEELNEKEMEQLSGGAEGKPGSYLVFTTPNKN